MGGHLAREARPKIPLRPVLITLALSLPGTAPALVPDPVCAVEPATGAIHPIEDPRGSENVWPVPYPGGMTLFDWRDPDNRLHGILQHCSTATSLRFMVPERRIDAARERLEDMLRSGTVHGFDEVRQVIRRPGGRARIVPSPGRCACDAVAGF